MFANCNSGGGAEQFGSIFHDGLTFEATTSQISNALDQVRSWGVIMHKLRVAGRVGKAVDVEKVEARPMMFEDVLDYFGKRWPQTGDAARCEACAILLC